jgi:hypothetical protein
MSREFSQAELAGVDRIFSHLEAAASVAGIDTVRDGVFGLGVGTLHNRTIGGGLAARAGFEPEGNADVEFIDTLATDTRGTVCKGLYLARHAAGLLIFDTAHQVGEETGLVRYDYRLRTVRTAEQPDQIIWARAAGSVGLTSSGVLQIDHTYNEHLGPPADFFGRQFNIDAVDQTIHDVLRANLYHN